LNLWNHASGEVLYTFDQFIQDFGREYSSDKEEYAFRKEIFQQNLNTIVQHNQEYLRQKEVLAQNQRSALHQPPLMNKDMNRVAQRQAVFEQNLYNHAHQVSESQAKQRKIKVTYTLGINEFADRLPEELFTGYDAMQSTRVRLSSSSRSSSSLSLISEDTSKVLRQRRQ
jgi:hypothetical protein